MTKLLKRTYRISEKQDEKVKKHSKKNKLSESGTIRKAIDQLK